MLFGLPQKRGFDLKHENVPVSRTNEVYLPRIIFSNALRLIVKRNGKSPPFEKLGEPLFDTPRFVSGFGASRTQPSQIVDCG